MTQKNKELLLKDLCAKLPYGVKVATNNFHNLTLLSVNINGIADVAPDNGYPMEINWEDCKPYLFPISSMTGEQKREYVHIANKCSTIASSQLAGMTIQDWFDKNHLDSRGLIPNGLAEDATGKNIY